MRTINFTNKTQDYHYACEGDNGLKIVYTGTETETTCKVTRLSDSLEFDSGILTLVDGATEFILPSTLLDVADTRLLIEFAIAYEGEIIIERRL